ncbi:TRAP transporter small permease [Sphaerotilus mobilis]|uniref:TRAP transporter small permease protein n=1 Tax=Sphaerotilus mobilis TaxID=47994 RepID=A0A4Q7LT43_9BURK|nr:TRAP transporter small permease [Sphaerotilus mobilis]RZS56909.1 TRAP-type mannitol/chloroaromatic compound transport system permease small subunit [Sphaerotilus mobilis]
MNEPLPGAGPAGVPPGFGPAGRLLLRTCQAAAVVGGLVFVALVLMSIVSIVGRKLASAPIPGDIEVLQMCAAVACATFFAYCHLVGGDVKVDFFTARLSARICHRLDAAGSALFGVIGLLLAWRTTAAALASQESGETSVVLAWPLWIAQMAMVPGFVLMALAGLYMVGAHLRTPVTGVATNHDEVRA